MTCLWLLSKALIGRERLKSQAAPQSSDNALPVSSELFSAALALSTNTGLQL